MYTPCLLTFRLFRLQYRNRGIRWNCGVGLFSGFTAPPRRRTEFTSGRIPPRAFRRQMIFSVAHRAPVSQPRATISFTLSPLTLGAPSLLFGPAPCYFALLFVTQEPPRRLRVTNQEPPDLYRLLGAHPRPPRSGDLGEPLRRMIRLIFLYSPPHTQTSGSSLFWPTPAPSRDDKAQHSACVNWRNCSRKPARVSIPDSACPRMAACPSTDRPARGNFVKRATSRSIESAASGAKYFRSVSDMHIAPSLLSI